MPLLSLSRHDAVAAVAALEGGAFAPHAASAASLYEEQVTCASCHSDYRPAVATTAPSAAPASATLL